VSAGVEHTIGLQQPEDSISFNLGLQGNSKMLAKNQINNIGP